MLKAKQKCFEGCTCGQLLIKSIHTVLGTIICAVEYINSINSTIVVLPELLIPLFKFLFWGGFNHFFIFKNLRANSAVKETLGSPPCGDLEPVSSRCDEIKQQVVFCQVCFCLKGCFVPCPPFPSLTASSGRKILIFCVFCGVCFFLLK